MMTDTDTPIHDEAYLAAEGVMAEWEDVMRAAFANARKDLDHYSVTRMGSMCHAVAYVGEQPAGVVLIQMGSYDNPYWVVGRSSDQYQCEDIERTLRQRGEAGRVGNNVDRVDQLNDDVASHAKADARSGARRR